MDPEVTGRSLSPFRPVWGGANWYSKTMLTPSQLGWLPLEYTVVVPALMTSPKLHILRSFFPNYPLWHDRYVIKDALRMLRLDFSRGRAGAL